MYIIKGFFSGSLKETTLGIVEKINSFMKPILISESLDNLIFIIFYSVVKSCNRLQNS